MTTLELSYQNLQQRADAYLHRLCVEIDNRRVGSGGNRAATTFFEETAAALGFSTETPTFDCMDWREAGALLSVGSSVYEVFPGPYSRGCRVRAPLVAAGSVEQLEIADAGGKVLLLHGDIAAGQLFPRNFPFFSVGEHQHIYHLLDSQQPAAIIAATGCDPNLAGGLYPFPLFEDGDFDIPSVYMTDVDGARLLRNVGLTATLASHAERIPATGCNVVARRGSGTARMVCFAHIDAKTGTPGAIDNASGVVTLLLLAELLADFAGGVRLELVALNGEDYYANPGERLYLAQNADLFGDILLGINVDGVGYRKGSIAYSLYECPPPLAAAIQAQLARYPALVAGEQWYQSDHFLFTMNGRPALALTSERVEELLCGVVHTAHDTPELVDTARLADAALALRDVILALA